MKKIDNLSSIDGRLLLQEIFYQLRFEKQRNSFSTLFILWRICISDSEINQYISQDISIMYKLGFWRGTSLWLEEIVNRYYFSTVNSFVYLGAAILLILVGINRFTDILDSSTVIYGLVFEGTMLIFMFIVMLFTPNDDIANLKKDNSESYEKELLHEIGEISRDFAVTSTQLDKITSHLFSIINRQNDLTNILLEISKTNADFVNPNPKMLEIMNLTNESLNKFNDNVSELNQTVNQLKYAETKIIVRQEIEKFLTSKINDNQNI